jgi:hypothetical protein
MCADVAAPPNTSTCQICYYTFSNNLPHLSCRDMHGEDNVDSHICQACFFLWIHGEIRSDNVGFRNRVRCRCGQKFTHEEIKSVLDPQQFEQYDYAMAKMCLESAKDVIYCPGQDCPEIYVRPKRKRTKRQCRKAVCKGANGEEGCGTMFCCLCGEKYTKEHQRMKCGPYKKWKKTNDEDTIAMERWRQSRYEQEAVMPCPKCKRDVEKNGGCRSMKCTNCRCNFCWNCGEVYRRRSGVTVCGCG